MITKSEIRKILYKYCSLIPVEEEPPAFVIAEMYFSKIEEEIIATIKENQKPNIQKVNHANYPNNEFQG